MKDKFKATLTPFLVISVLLSNPLVAYSNEDTDFMKRFQKITQKPVKDFLPFDRIEDLRSEPMTLNIKNGQIYFNHHLVVDMHDFASNSNIQVEVRTLEDGMAIDYGVVGEEGQYKASSYNNRAKHRVFINHTGKKKLTSSLSSHNSLVDSEKGFALAVKQYDNQYRITSERYFDELKKPTLNTDGHHQKRYFYNSDGSLEGIYYMDIDGKAMSIGLANTKQNREKIEVLERTKELDSSMDETVKSYTEAMQSGERMDKWFTQ